MIAWVQNGIRRQDFIDIADLTPQELRGLIELAHAIKAGRWSERPLEGRHIAMLFEPSPAGTLTWVAAMPEASGGDRNHTSATAAISRSRW